MRPEDISGEDILKFSRVVVKKYLATKPELETFRDDMVQEAAVKLVEVLANYNPTYGHDLELWMDYQARFAVQNYINRREKKHFRKQPVDHESPYWDLHDPVEIDELPDESGYEREATQRALMETFAGVELTSREQEFLEAWLDLGQLTLVAEALDISTQRASALWKQIVAKAQEANEVEL